MLDRHLEGLLRECPVMGPYENTWGQRCPRRQFTYGERQNAVPESLNFGAPHLQCFGQENFHIINQPVPQCFSQNVLQTANPVNCVQFPFYDSNVGPTYDSVPSPQAYYEYPPLDVRLRDRTRAVQGVLPGLPCVKPRAGPWDYSTMCFDVNGDQSYQPCRYAAVVDLEDFMNNEKRKEKSRVAARCRRNKEQHIFQDLTDALPVRKEDVEQLDKASVMRLAISYLRVRDVVSMLPEARKEEGSSSEEVPAKGEDVSYLQALDGFVFVISQLGDIVYCSENVADHLGISQLEIMGQSVFELSHPCDHEELREVLRARALTPRPSSFLLRLKCTLTGKGRSVHLKSASYKVIQFTGHVIMPTEEEPPKTPENSNNIKSDEVQAAKSEEVHEKIAKVGSLIAVGRPIPHPANIEIPLDNKTFLTKHSLDMKFTYCDQVLQESLGFVAGELVGQSLYEHQHTADSSALAQHFKTLFSKGQCETGRYRFLAKTGGYAWVQTQATLINDKQQRPVSVVCVNFFISGIECKDEVFSTNQMRHADLKPAPLAASPPLPVPVADIKPVVPPVIRTPKLVAAPVPNGAIVEEIPNNGAIVIPAPTEEARPRPATAQIFAPRTKDMNKGYLMFSEDDSGLTMLKEEPEDLTHLAPTAGDACIPLEDSPFDMFDEFILGDNYCSLLGDDLANGSPVDSLGGDPLLLSSPEPQESDSSCEQPSLLTELSLDAIDGRSEGELDGRAPYIPMSGRDELPLLAPAVMWGALPDSVSLARPSPPEPAMPPLAAPSLQRLLAAPPHTGPPPQDIITNIYADQGLIPGGGVTTWDTGVKRGRNDSEESSTAKRSRRSGSPATESASSPTSSVLMNLLDTPGPPIQRNHKIIHSTLSFLPPHLQYIIPNTPPIQNQPRVLNLPQIFSPMSPLTLNLASPAFNSATTSPGSSPSVSPLVSPYPTPPTSNSMSPLISPQSCYNRVVGKTSLLSPGRLTPGSGKSLLSPGDVLQTGCDPFLTNRMLSPSINYNTPDTIMERDKVSLDGLNSWMDSGDILQEAGNLLGAYDEVRLV